MAFSDLREYLDSLDKRGDLKRIGTPVDPVLEMTEIADRTVKKGGPALLFERPKGSGFPVAMNLFGTLDRMAFSLGVSNLDEIGGRISRLLSTKLPTGVLDGLKVLKQFRELIRIPPKTVSSGPCKEVVKEKADLSKLPILKCWPGDAGRFITLPMVFTRDPETGERNCGIYRMQVHDESTTGMHWQIHKGGAKHYHKAGKLGKRLEVAVAIGSDPATMFSAAAPMPEFLDEMLLAGFIRKEAVRMVKCESVDLEVPASSEFVLEGYLKPGELRREGPFGDHTGYYSMPDEFPVFHVTCLTRRENAIYPATIVGKPVMEDAYIGKAVERIFLPVVKAMVPEIVDINLPYEGVFHNLCIVSIRKRYPGQARKTMMALWGLGMMMLTKVIVVVDASVNVQDLREVLWAVASRFDPSKDVVLIDRLPADTLDHASYVPNLGGKMGIDATRKLKEEGYDREWPGEICMSEEVRKRVGERWKEFGL